jgi:hypothetical protein
MKTEIAQMVALTCYGNAAIRGIKWPQFFPNNSTCQFCDSVTFVELKKTWLGKVQELQVATTPDEWLERIAKNATSIALSRSAQNNPGIVDRMAAAFVGGGGSWRMNVALRDTTAESWGVRWNMWNQNAADRKIWRVTYGLLGKEPTRQATSRTLAEAKRELDDALVDIHAFASHNNCGGFTECFTKAIEALRNPVADPGYHKDLYVDGTLSIDAEEILGACRSAWVFGGMGSWNDLSFEGAEEKNYEQVSAKLYDALNNAIEAAATSSSKSF